MSREVHPYISRSTILVVWLLALVLALPFAGAQEEDDISDEGVLKGVVFNLHYESPVPNAYILVESNVGYKEARSTNEDGEYRFHLPYGAYNLRAFVRDQEVANATGIFVDPSTIVHDIYISFVIAEPVQLHGVIKLDGNKAREKKVVFEGLDNSYRNETVTGKDGSYSLDVPFGNLLITAYEGNEFAGDKKVGPFVTAGPQETKVDIARTGAAPSFGEWTDFIVATWSGIAIWGAIVFGLIVAYMILSRRVNLWLEGEKHRFSSEMVELLAYAAKGYGRVILLYVSLLALAVFIDIEHDAAQWIRFWLYALVMSLALWVTARLLMLIIDYLMIRLRKQKVAEGSQVPETAYIFIHGILRYTVIAVFGFFILLIVLSGAGLYDEIAGSVSGFVDYNFGYLIFLVIILILFFITSRFVKLTFTQMGQTSTRFTPQMLRIFGFIAKIAIIGLFTVLFLFVLLTMAGMQEMGALIMALLTTTIGMIVAMTTTGAMGNALSGMVIMTLKPIEPGQYVEVGNEQFGYVVDIGTFFTKLKTFKNEIIEIPNNLVLAQTIKNYSKRKNIGIEIELGIGYDIPADDVLDLLKNGAKGTNKIIKDPKPQAMVTDFGDYAIKYLLRAFTDDVDRYFQTKSSLMENVQELFYTEGIEIMTPWQIMKREDTCPSREEVIQRYADHLKHKEKNDVDDKKVAAGMQMFDDETPKEA